MLYEIINKIQRIQNQILDYIIIIINEEFL